MPGLTRTRVLPGSQVAAVALQGLECVGHSWVVQHVTDGKVSHDLVPRVVLGRGAVAVSPDPIVADCVMGVPTGVILPIDPVAGSLDTALKDLCSGATHESSQEPASQGPRWDLAPAGHRGPWQALHATLVRYCFP